MLEPLVASKGPWLHPTCALTRPPYNTFCHPYNCESRHVCKHICLSIYLSIYRFYCFFPTLNTFIPPRTGAQVPYPRPRRSSTQDRRRSTRARASALGISMGGFHKLGLESVVRKCGFINLVWDSALSLTLAQYPRPG